MMYHESLSVLVAAQVLDDEFDLTFGMGLNSSTAAEFLALQSG
jgi:hypothetical protein